MIDSIIEGIGAALHGEFGEGYGICTEGGQGLNKSGFFIQCQGFSCGLFRGERYFREQRFRIRYFPESDGDKNKLCYGVAERLNRCLEYIAAQGGMRGTKMEAQFGEGMLDYYVNYDCFSGKKEEAEVMEEWKTDVKAKENK